MDHAELRELAAKVGAAASLAVGARSDPTILGLYLREAVLDLWHSQENLTVAMAKQVFTQAWEQVRQCQGESLAVTRSEPVPARMRTRSATRAEPGGRPSQLRPVRLPGAPCAAG